MLDAARVRTLLQEGTALVLAQLRSGGSPWVEPASGPPRSDVVEDQLLALLKAFLDAARPAGGLPVDDRGQPLQLRDLVDAGFRLARAGDNAPKFLAKVRAGKPVDLRMAEAALAFLRTVLDRPALALEHLGAQEPGRLRLVRQVDAAIRAMRQDLPASLYDGLASRARETAGYSTVFDQASYEYRGFERFVDAGGVQRLRVLRVFRYQPVRVARFPGLLRPSMAFEWHEWAHAESAQLTVRLLDDHGRTERVFQPAIRKWIDPARGLIVFDMEPAAAAQLRPWLGVPPAGSPGPRHELCWEQWLVFNLADRDIVVNYQPMNRPRILFDAEAHPDIDFHVGDSPGIRPCAGGWQLDRALMPREVLAVRFRPRGFTAADALALSASGEHRVDREVP